MKARNQSELKYKKLPLHEDIAANKDAPDGVPPEEKDINALLVSSSMEVKRFWVKTMLVRVATRATQKIALKLA